MHPLLRAVNFLLLWGLSSSVQCAEISFVDGHKNTEIHIDGPILAGDDKKFLQVVRNDLVRFFQSGRISVNSPGGDVETAMKLAKLIEDSGLNLTVENGAVCASACFLLYVSAPIRVAKPGAQVIIHRPYYDMTNAHGANQGTSAEAYQRTNLQMRDYLVARATPDVLINRMMQTPSSQGYALTTEDLTSLHLMNIPVQEYAIQRCGYQSYAAPGSTDCIKNYLQGARLAFVAKYVNHEEGPSAESSAKNMGEFIEWLKLMESTDPMFALKINIATEAIKSNPEPNQEKRIQLLKTHYQSLSQNPLLQLTIPYD